MDRILVSTDGSDCADRAVDFAADMAKKSGAQLLIVNVIGGYGLPGDIFREITRAEHAWINELLGSMSTEILTKARDRARDAGVANVHLESRRGEIAQTIIEIADEKQAEMIIVGKRGTGRVGGLLLGSVSQKLVSLADRPVVVIP